MSPEEIRSHLERWSEVWGTPGLPREVNVRPSRRMYRTLGNYSPSRDEIRIAAHLLDTGGRDMFLEVLGHEAAHAAVRRLFPRGVRPHGSEWKDLMTEIGLPPRASLPVPPAVAKVVTERRAKRRAARSGWTAASPRGDIIRPLRPGETVKDSIRPIRQARKSTNPGPVQEEIQFGGHAHLDRVRRRMEKELDQIRQELRRRGVPDRRK